ncbi:hypothetical protein [[Kitasatospora] papulosa]|uniref:hypothetical protein n=1 Tax=[Kitasatospora] papulosa TaxID=1464011 RepID=UPI00362B38B2
MAPEDYNVRPGETKSIACPDCRTWRRIMGDKVLKIREHCVSDKVAERGKHTTCPGSDQLVVVDIDVRRWQVKQDRLLREAMPQENRRAVQQFYKPLPATATPISRFTAEITLETTRRSYLAHRQGCAACVGGEQRKHCTDGDILARRYVLALQEEPARREAREQQERQDRHTAQKQSAAAVRKKQWAKHGGAVVETANNRCADRFPGSLSEFRGPHLPLGPQDERAHNERQSELGKQYAHKRATAAA